MSTMVDEHFAAFMAAFERAVKARIPYEDAALLEQVAAWEALVAHVGPDRALEWYWGWQAGLSEEHPCKSDSDPYGN